MIPIIWAYSNINPGSFSPSANIAQHRDSGTTTLDLTKQLTSASATTRAVDTASTGSALATASQVKGKPSSTGECRDSRRLAKRVRKLNFPLNSATTNLTVPQATRVVGGSSDAASIPYTAHQRIIIAHATFGGLGAMVLIPSGIVSRRLPSFGLRNSRSFRLRFSGHRSTSSHCLAELDHRAL